MAAITHVFTLARVAEMLGEDEDLLYEISIEMEPEDGVIHVYGTDDDGTTAFTDFGIENLRELLHRSTGKTPAQTRRRLSIRSGPDRPLTIFLTRTNMARHPGLSPRTPYDIPRRQANWLMIPARKIII